LGEDYAAACVRATALVEGRYFSSDLITVRDVQRMRCLNDDQQCFRCNRGVTDLLQPSDDFILAGDMLLAEGNARLGLCQMPYQRFTAHSLA
jgi:hypothetical protein